MTDNDEMPYGKYKGTAMANVPAPYLLWLNSNTTPPPEVKKYIDEHKEQLQQEQANGR